MNEVDDLQSFIADCEWKTRKILRESNKRMTDNARSLAAKERVEKLRQKGTVRSPGGLATKASAPKSTSLNRSLTKNMPTTPVKERKGYDGAESTSLNRSLTKKMPTTPVKEWKGRDGPKSVRDATNTRAALQATDWKGREKIISDAYETIKSFPVDKSSSLRAVIREESRQSERARRAGIHSSLSASPFRGSGGDGPDARVGKSKQRSSSGRDVDDDPSTGNGEPAIVTRRTIERDFYIMSKKRSAPTSKRRRGEEPPEPPPLETSVLRKKYRCDERYMEARRKRAERSYERLTRLTLPDDDDDDESVAVGAAGATGGGDGADDECDDSSVSSDEEEPVHALHELVERHVDDENVRSLKRSDKMLASLIFKPDVKEYWAQLSLGGLMEGGGSVETSRGQVPSVPFRVATKIFDSVPGETIDVGNSGGRNALSMEQRPVRRYVSPYREPSFAKLPLVVNEPLMAPSVDRTIPLTVSVSVMRGSNADPDPFPANVIWTYEVYDPCNGNSMSFTLSNDGFDSMNDAMRSSASNRPESSETVEKIVHRQTASHDGVERTFVVLVSADENGIASKVYRSDGVVVDGLDGLCVEENLIANLRACEVLQLTKKHHVHSAHDREFWLDRDNGVVIWRHLVEVFRDGTAEGACNAPSEDAFSLMSATIKAHDSFLALTSNLNRTGAGGIERIYEMMREHSIEDHELLVDSEHKAPLSMRISGCSPYSNTVCPGHAPIGKGGAWRFSEPLVDERTDSMFPIWPSLKDMKYPKALDKSQASAFFYRKTLGPQKGDCVTVLNSLAFESPVLSPYCYVIDEGYISPPFSEHEALSGIIPYVHLPCTSLLENPVESRFDVLLPPPVIVLDPGASEDDWKDAPVNSDGNAYHCRELNEFDDDGFRLRTFARRVEYDDAISSVVYGISEKAASPNSPAISRFLTHTSRETCTQSSLSRKRTAADYHYIAESDGEGTLSEPYLFTTHMGSYNSVFVSRKSISSYREQERFLHATKEAESKRLNLALKMKAAEELLEERLKERIARIEHSVNAQELLADVCDNSVALELPSSSKDSTTPIQEKVPCDVELPLPSNGLLDDNIDEENELDQLANLLLKNADFLKAVARKLSISEEQVMQIDSTIEEDNDMDHGNHHDDLLDRGAEKPALRHETPTALEAKSMPKLKLNCIRYRDSNRAGSKGDGWKRLPRSETIIGDFSLTKRNVQRGIGGPKFKKLEGERNFIAVNAMRELPHEIDSRQFAPEPKSLFVPDLTTERLRLAKTYRQQKKAKESMLSMSQQQSLDEILQIPVSSVADKATEETEEKLDVDQGDKGEGTLLESDPRPVDHVARVILAVKNHNMAELELVLDTEGLSVETRDYHGNTLFVLACQQGSKKLAKFLLRRGADMNAQNNGGNTALHYLYEYKHTSLADYLIRKGADDSIRNGVSNTCYEGLEVDEL